MATLLRQRMRWAFLLISAYAVSNIARELTRGRSPATTPRASSAANIVLGAVLCLLAVWLWSGRRPIAGPASPHRIIGIGLAVLLVAIAQHLWFMQARPWPDALLAQQRSELPWGRNWFYPIAAAPAPPTA